MKTLQTVLPPVNQDCWLCSLALRDAYFSVHVQEESQNYLKFKWLGQLYRFTAFPNGSSSAPQLFTKLLRPVMAPLHHFREILFNNLH